MINDTTFKMKPKNKTIITNDLSKEVFNLTYKFGDETIDDMFYRVASHLASVEQDTEYWTEKFYEILTDFKFVPGGRILSNAGTNLKGTTMINCFVSGFEGNDRDSMVSILDELRRQALILKSEGGYGFCVDTLRPRGGFILGIANESPGAVKMLEMWDKQSDVITSGSGKKSVNKKAKGKIRKGAQMVTMSVFHPDIEEYITAKQTKGRLEKFNMSVLVSDDFMDAVENHKKWDLIFPDYEADMETYKKEWDGNINKWKAKGYPIKVYKTLEDANILWNLIMESTYNRNEPGVLFIDTINRLNNLYYEEYISATNPCGEQVLPTGGVCLLGSINLTQFINKDNWNYNKLEEVVQTAIRLMDNVNDLTNVPLDIQKKNLKEKRRIGLGIMGYGSALLMMKKRYGSKEALKLTDELMTFIANISYKTSAKLAAEKGVFLLYDEEKYLKSNFIKNLDKDTISLIKENGIRNSHLLSVQPTGNTSSFANVISSGLEPIFLPEYIRTAIIPHVPNGLLLPEGIDWFGGTAKELHGWTWIKEGDENMLTTEFKNEIYKYDNNRGLTKENLVIDYGVKYLKDKGEYDENAEWNVNTSKLTIDDHVETMKIISKWLDSAMSKTINLPNDYPYEDFKDVYMKLYKSGTIKGGTTYRDGTMASVLSSTDSKNKTETRSNKIIKTHAPKRPKDLQCDIHHLTAKGLKWIVIVGLYEDDPYEVFAFRQKQLQLPKKFKHGYLRKAKSGVYNLMEDLEGDGLIIEDIKEFFERDEDEALTRIISTALRHGADVRFVIEQLNKAEGNIVSFSKAIARTLKKYLKENSNMSGITCDNCGGNNIVIEDGCFKCLDCGASKCS